MSFDCSYNLVDDVDGKFAINATSGILTSQKALDREDTPLYHLTVVVKDHGSLAKSAEANITVYVDDVNDNVPSFEKQVYNQTLNNPTSAGTKKYMHKNGEIKCIEQITKYSSHTVIKFCQMNKSLSFERCVKQQIMFVNLVIDFTGQFVVGVTAVDRDVGPNGRVTYQLQGCPKFNLDSQRGVITTADFLSGGGTQFTCTIEARDQVRGSFLDRVTHTF